MKRVNFKAVKVETSIDNFEIVDLRKDIGNALYKRAESVSQDDLARRIYHTEGEIEIEDQDFSEMMQIIEKSFVRYIHVAISNAVKNVDDKVLDEVERVSNADK